LEKCFLDESGENEKYVRINKKNKNNINVGNIGQDKSNL
jgi:hypothetical protein